MAFGPQNFGVSIGEAEQLAREKLAMVGIHEEFLKRILLSYLVVKCVVWLLLGF